MGRQVIKSVIVETTPILIDASTDDGAGPCTDGGGGICCPGQSGPPSQSGNVTGVTSPLAFSRVTGWSVETFTLLIPRTHITVAPQCFPAPGDCCHGSFPPGSGSGGGGGGCSGPPPAPCGGGGFFITPVTSRDPRDPCYGEGDCWSNSGSIAVEWNGSKTPCSRDLPIACPDYFHRYEGYGSLCSHPVRVIFDGFTCSYFTLDSPDGNPRTGGLCTLPDGCPPPGMAREFILQLDILIQFLDCSYSNWPQAPSFPPGGFMAEVAASMTCSSAWPWGLGLLISPG